MFNRILVPLDGSPISERALAAAAGIASSDGAQIYLLRVVPLPASYSPYTITLHGTMPVSIEHSIEQALDYLYQIADSPVCEGVSTTISVEVGAPGPTILDAVAALHADLVVMSTHGREGVARWVLGSVAQHVARYSPAPVLLMRPDDTGASASAWGYESVARVLVPLDGSSLAETALGPAIRLGCALSGTGRCAAHLLFVVDSRAAEMDCIPEPVAIGRAEGYLARVAARLESEQASQLAAPVTMAVVVGTDVAGTIQRVAEVASAGSDSGMAGAFDVVAMSTHARGGLPRWTLGSVTEQVMRRGGVPLLIVRPVARPAEVEATAFAKQVSE